jgi:hypothetical protein
MVIDEDAAQLVANRAGGPVVAHCVISRQRSNSVAIGA